jgi:CRISPR type III-A-associated protein Csm2
MIMSKWTEKIPDKEITEKVTEKTVDFAMRFGKHLGTNDEENPLNGQRPKVINAKLTTNQLRKFFGEVKHQQMEGYNPTDFVLLKPKLAYAVGRTKEKSKIEDFYFVIANAIDQVKTENHFKNFIKIFEAIVAYHKAAEAGKINENVQ